MIAHINRAPFTAAVITAVATCGKPVGFCEAPVGGGYQGEHGKSEFVPYSVITPMAASGGSGPIYDPQADVSFGYSLTNVANDPVAVENMADKSRAAALSLLGSVIAGKQVAYVWVAGYGQIMRNDADSPPYFAQTDTITLSILGG